MTELPATIRHAVLAVMMASATGCALDETDAHDTTESPLTDDKTKGTVDPSQIPGADGLILDQEVEGCTWYWRTTVRSGDWCSRFRVSTCGEWGCHWGGPCSDTPYCMVAGGDPPGWG